MLLGVEIWCMRVNVLEYLCSEEENGVDLRFFFTRKSRVIFSEFSDRTHVFNIHKCQEPYFFKL